MRPLRSPFLRRAAAGLAATTVAGALLLAGAGAAQAAPPAQTVFLDQSFGGASAGPDFLLPVTPSGNVACLTAGTDQAASPIPGCGFANDPEGSGALRLTDTGGSQSGGVGSTVAVPTAQGLDVAFDSWQYGGSGADGLTFYLAATDPFDPQVPTRLGGVGGALGYSALPESGQEGLANAYLGVGLDWYGNFANPAFNGSSCEPVGGVGPNALTLRGPGNGSAGYCVLSSTQVDGLLRGSTGVRDEASRVPVEVAVNPSAAAITTASGLEVEAGSYVVAVQGIGDGEPTVARGALPSLLGSSTDPSWYDPTTGVPYKLTFGWTGGTGGATDYHEVANARATTLAGPAPVLVQTTSGSATVVPTRGSTVSVAASVSADGGAESEPVVATLVFPEGLAPTLPSAATGWACTVSGQTVTCTVVPSPEFAAGASLPVLTVPYTATADAAGALTVLTTVSSTDSAAATSQLEVSAVREPTVVTSSSGRQTPGTTGPSTVFTADVASAATSDPTAPLGTVEFVDSATEDLLCEADLVPAASGATSTATCTADADPSTAVRVDYDQADAAHEPTRADLGSFVVVTTPVALAAGAVVVDGDAQLSVTGLPADATGTVVFSTGATTLCTVTLPTVACTVPDLADGSYTVTAAYSGDAVYAAAEATASFRVGTVAAPVPAPVDPAAPAAPVVPAATSAPVATAPVADDEEARLAFTGSTLVAWTAGALGLALAAAGVVLVAARRRGRTA